MQAYADRAALNETLQTRYFAFHCPLKLPLVFLDNSELRVLLADLQPFTAGHAKVVGAKAKHLGTSSKY